MKSKKTDNDMKPRDPKLPPLRADDPRYENSMGTTSVVPVAAPWILPPDWPPVSTEH